jgi:hypothetical protein
MRINDIVASAVGNATAKLGGAASKLRRTAILYAICAFCAVAAIVFATSATLIALEPAVGTVYARLILAGVFALIAAAIVLAVWALNRPRHAPEKPVPLQAQPAQAQAARSSAQFAQLAMIVEAVMLGYSMARKR